LGSPVTYDVNVSRLDPANPTYGWVIYVVTDDSTLSPVGISLGQILPDATTSVLCINGVAQPGSQGCSSDDGAGIVHYEVYSLAGSGAAVNGTLFTISYTAKVAQTCTTCYSLVNFKAVRITNGGVSPALYDQAGNAITEAPPVRGGYGSVPQLPVAMFSWTPLLPFELDRVNFTAIASTTPTGTMIVNYAWQFYSPSGGFTFASGVNISRFFGPVDAGNWTVVLTVTNDKGVKSEDTSQTITVLAKNILDLGITSFSSSEFDGILPGDVVTFTFNVQNLGTIVPKNGFNVSLTVAKSFYHVRYNGTLDVSSQQFFKYNWNTAGIQPDSYTVHARVNPLPGENFTNNNDAYITVRVVVPQQSGALLSLNLLQFSGFVVLALVIVSFVVFLFGRAKRRRLMAQQELL
jgi:PKD repeat protein